MSAKQTSRSIPSAACLEKIQYACKQSQLQYHDLCIATHGRCDNAPGWVLIYNENLQLTQKLRQRHRSHGKAGVMINNLKVDIVNAGQIGVNLVMDFATFEHNVTHDDRFETVRPEILKYMSSQKDLSDMIHFVLVTVFTVKTKKSLSQYKVTHFMSDEYKTAKVLFEMDNTTQ